jgi:hypothetical protein
MEKLHESDMVRRIDGNENADVTGVEAEERFARIVAAELAGVLKVNHADRDIVVKLLTTELERMLTKSGGLLEQYLHTQLDKIAGTLKRRFDLPENIEVNYNYATHAKLENFIEAIQEEYETKFNGNI